MPSFSVTAAGQKVNLGISGAAQASFTVTNTSTQTLKGRMLTKPSESASPDWFSVVGETVRDFAPDAAERVVVQLQVPPTAPAGSYSFRLDAVSAVDPDEDFTEGPTVAFDVEAQPPPPKKFPWVPWWVIAVAGGESGHHAVYFCTFGLTWTVSRAFVPGVETLEEGEHCELPLAGA